jgi:hypothetical protein
VVFPALSLKPSQLRVFETFGIQGYVQSEEKEFGML